MLIIGIGGLAKDIICSLIDDYRHGQFYFFDNVSPDPPELFLGRFPVYRSFEALQAHFQEKGPEFNSALANPLLRQRMNQRVQSLGGRLTTIMSHQNRVSDFVEMGPGLIIQPYVTISADVRLGEGVFINCGGIIGHDVQIGDYCSLGPSVRILGHVHIGEHSYIGANAVICPGVKIGKKVRIGIGKIIDRDIPDNQKIL